jgi:hypothetical protein
MTALPTSRPGLSDCHPRSRDASVNDVGAVGLLARTGFKVSSVYRSEADLRNEAGNHHFRSQVVSPR